ncbi:MAG TPA: diacylglycerol kinase family protein [Vicinamibacterales bacterium]|nr:diacylglycerol kinase family protein [Vicinamibacterales bacterium]
MDEAPVERIAIVRNPRSGTAPDTATLEQAIRTARLDARVHDAPAGDAFAPWIDRLAAGVDLIVAAGGDGTVSAVATAAAKASRTLGIIPTGTLNHFARDTGIPTEIDEALDAIRTGRDQSVDVGTVNGHLFLNNVSLGNYPRMVRHRTKLETRGLSRRLSGTVAAFETWWDLRSVTAALTLDGEHITRRSPFIVIANGSYVLSGFSLGQREQINDSRLSVYVAPRSGRFGALMLPLRALVGNLEQYEQFEIMSAKAVKASLRYSRIAVGIDGEVRELQTPLEFAIQRQALRVRVPRPAEP